MELRGNSALRCAGIIRTYRTCGHTCIRYVQRRGNRARELSRKRAQPTYINWRAKKCTYRRRARRGINAARSETECRIQNPWAGGKTISGVFWIPLGQAALLRVRPGAFLFDLARLYTPAQRLD
jgi:hypothetical protein